MCLSSSFIATIDTRYVNMCTGIISTTDARIVLERMWFRPGFIALGTVLMRRVPVVSPVKRLARFAITIYGEKRKRLSCKNRSIGSLAKRSQQCSSIFLFIERVVSVSDRSAKSSARRVYRTKYIITAG